MTIESLLHELESLTHSGRMRRMYQVGRLAREDAEIKGVLAALEGGDSYQRRLVLQSCSGSGDGAAVLRALEDPSRMVRGLALSLVAVVCDDDEVARILTGATFGERRLLLRALRKRHRTAPVDALLGILLHQGDADVGRLLAFGSPEFVAGHVETVAERAVGLGGDDWSRLARWVPDVCLQLFHRRAASVTQLDLRLLRDVNAALPALSETRPDQTLKLVRALTSHIALARLSVQRLAERRPKAMTALIESSPDAVPVDFSKVAHRLPLEVLLRLVERRSETLRSTLVWLRRLAPASRAAVWNVCEHGWRDASGRIGRDIVALLPSALRESEGRRHLALPALATRPAERLPFAALLPWEERLGVLQPFIRNPDADLRSAAWGALIYGVRFGRDRLPELLAMIEARGNEQDPVRGTILGGLAALPPGTYKAEQLDALARIIRQALDAPDLSPATASMAERLVIALLPFHPDWAAEWLATLVCERGRLNLSGLQNRLSDADVRRIAPSLLPVVRSWETREREMQLLGLATNLGRRLEVWDELVELLERVLHVTPSSHVAEAALNLIARYRRERLPVLIPELLRHDPSWATRPVVYTYLHRHRQDLISDYLGRHAWKGRFGTGRTRWILPLVSGFERWLPIQQELFAGTLSELSDDDQRDTPALLFAIRQMAALPDVEVPRLFELASLANARPATRDAALRALGCLDAAQGVPVLIEALSDERARIAIYALRGALKEMPESRALELLRTVPLQKVTVAKEVVRLLGELKSEQSYRELLAFDARDLHRDVRVALLRALWDRLEYPETWPILERAAVADDPAIATIVGRIPAERLSIESQARLVALVATLLRHPDPKVRLDALGRCAQMPLSDMRQVLLSPLLDALGSSLPDECSAAASAVFATYAGRQAPLVGAAAERIVSNRKALNTFVNVLIGQFRWSRVHLLQTARAVLDALASDPILAVLRVELAAATLPSDELAVFLERMVDAGQMHVGVLAAAIRAIEATSLRLALDALEQIETALRNSRDERLRRLALAALVAGAHAPHGWNDARFVRLRAMREDASPLVASAAQFTFTPGE